ncbi:serine/threonine protein kinase [Paenibacillus validus]|uniref:Serine/threonine protein kinase n=2 Tax=Paenibacillus TaxID=44249 RepID=A0A7X2ZBH5_9BACL|nr:MULTISPECIES: serine/threonine protein kinase [Paenibacillus]MED4604323.1 serine/threonine protein kinase [Paenibacillus validus]MED4608828.1 serine/threonine protein kinase [Paenibacillus validus]MUG71910.1 serine/threonine protein kinase [Paenibacillus validus]
MQHAALIECIEQELLPGLRIASEREHEPVTVYEVPGPWRTLGVGNYAAVLLHPAWPDWVVKVYAPGRPGLEEEAEVYRRLGRHPAYSECLHAGAGYLVLRRLTGITLYNCMRRGIPIPRQVIEDIDEALKYARKQGLNPHDVHGKNVMQQDGRGKVVDVSDFLKEEPCEMWDDLKRAYYRFYFPWVRRVEFPDFLLNSVRKGYRVWKKCKRTVCRKG